MKLGFVCVHNAGRSQMAAAFAERERAARGREDFEIVTGGTDPAAEIHPEVREAMAEVGIDLTGREPQAVDSATLESCDVVATMGCSTLSLDADVDVHDWALPDPQGASPERVREIREMVRERVDGLFEDLVGGETDASD